MLASKLDCMIAPMKKPAEAGDASSLWVVSLAYLPHGGMVGSFQC